MTRLNLIKINRLEREILLTIKVINYTPNPLSLMGECASYCWGSAPSTQIGIDCIESGHGRSKKGK